ncbi:MAG: TonB-dependent receptor [Sphingobium sp.]
MRFTTGGRVCSAIALAAGLGAATPALAQPEAAGADDNSVIVVTAQRRAERSVDVPITLTTVTGEQLTSAGANQLSDLARVAPALRFDSSAAWVQPSIRGIGTAVTSSGSGANVGIYVDGFYSPNPLAADFQLMNVQSIQVLKGPQGTLFGRNTTGGAILITTAEPSTEPAAQVKASYGRFNTQRYQGYGTFGLTENIAVDVEGLYSRGDGFVRNILTGSKKDGKYENWSVRGGVKANVTEDISVLLRYTHSRTNDPTMVNSNIYTGTDAGLVGGVGTGQPSGLYATDPDEIALNAPRQFKSNTDVFQGTIKADLGFADLSSYTQYRTEDSIIIEDLDQTAAPVFLIHIGVKDKTFSQELLLNSKPGGPLQWTGGLFYFQNKDSWSIFAGTPTTADPYARVPFGRSSTTTESFAAFADLTYEISPRFFLTAGGRYSHDVVRDAYYTVGAYPALGYPPTVKNDKFTPRVVLRYKPTAQSSVYASFTKGYKAPMLDVGNTDATIPATARAVQPEDINAYEVGFKFDNRELSVDFATFYYDYKNLQVSVYRGTAQANILNAATSRIWGLDGQVSYRIGKQFSLNIGGAYTNARYKDFPQAPIASGPFGGFFVTTPTPLRNVPMQRVPDFTGNVGARYAIDLHGAGQLALSGNFYYTSAFYFGPSGTQFRQSGYEQLALRAEWTDPSDRYSLAVYGDNITDRRYRTQLLPNGFGIGNVWNYPATWGVQVGAKF